MVVLDCFSVCDLTYITNMESGLSMHYHCDDLGDLSNEHVDNIDNKIDVNVDSNVANFWGFADPALDPSFLYHYECSDELYFTNQLPKGIVSMEVYADPSITCYNKSNVRSKRQKR